MSTSVEPISDHDAQILRDLAKQVAEIAASEENQRRIREWKNLNALKPEKPMILILPEGAWGEIFANQEFLCKGDEARGMEWDLRHRIAQWELFPGADNVVDPVWNTMKAIHVSGWGLEAKHHEATQSGGSWSFDPVLEDEDDLKKIQMPQVTHDAERSAELFARNDALFGDLLDHQLVGIKHISFHFMSLYTGWRGLEETLCDFYEEPEMLHEAMRLLQQGYDGMLRQYEEQNLLSLNNDQTWLGSGAYGWTDELPAEGFDPKQVRLKDMWGAAEDQELSEVSPAMHEEFVWTYVKPLLEKFALSMYGCCESLDHKLSFVLQAKNMRRVSISPWATVKHCAGIMGERVIMNWKPNPAMMVGEFNQGHIRSYIRQALEDSKGTPFEMVLKDTHTVDRKPERFTIWSQIAREEVDRFIGA